MINFATLIPELAVSNCEKSLAFYCGILGFSISYQRKDEGFAFLERDGAQLMLDEIGKGRTFTHPNMDFEKPLGRGVNLQIKVESVRSLLDKVIANGVALFLPLEEKWYRCGDEAVGHRQFVVADPDGYLLRFYENLSIKN